MRKDPPQVLTIGLEPDAKGARVSFVLRDGEEHSKVEVRAARLGIPANLPRRKPLKVELTKELEVWLKNGFGTGRTRIPVWLELKGHATHLAAVGWERLLVPLTRRPVLRKPGVDAEPSFVLGEPGIVVCASIPVAKPDLSPARRLVSMIKGALPGSRVHVFADESFGWGERLDRQGLVVYDPGEALATKAGRFVGAISKNSDRLRSPWLRWMVERLAGEVIHAVVFACPGWTHNGAGALALAEHPRLNIDRNWSHYVGVDELRRFLDMLGASRLGLVARETVWTMGHRVLAEQLASLRAGSTMIHAFARHPAQSVVSDTLGFWFSRAPSPPPRPSQELTLYCERSRVMEVSARDSLRPMRVPWPYNAVEALPHHEVGARGLGQSDVAQRANWDLLARTQARVRALHERVRTLDERTPWARLPEHYVIGTALAEQQATRLAGAQAALDLFAKLLGQQGRAGGLAGFDGTARALLVSFAGADAHDREGLHGLAVALKRIGFGWVLILETFTRDELLEQLRRLVDETGLRDTGLIAIVGTRRTIELETRSAGYFVCPVDVEQPVLELELARQIEALDQRCANVTAILDLKEETAPIVLDHETASQISKAEFAGATFVDKLEGGQGHAVVLVHKQRPNESRLMSLVTRYLRSFHADWRRLTWNDLLSELLPEFDNRLEVAGPTNRRLFHGGRRAGMSS